MDEWTKGKLVSNAASTGNQFIFYRESLGPMEIAVSRSRAAYLGYLVVIGNIWLLVVGRWSNHMQTETDD